MPKGLRIRITGEIKWKGKQGRLEIFYDDLTGRWYAHNLWKLINQVSPPLPERELSWIWE